MPLTTPTIHLNGTRKTELGDGYEAAYNALQLAYDAIKQTSPNGRDYYTQDPSAWGKADRQHFERLKRVHDVMKEFEALLEACE
jgi:hypothetical protein